MWKIKEELLRKKGFCDIVISYNRKGKDKK